MGYQRSATFNPVRAARCQRHDAPEVAEQGRHRCEVAVDAASFKAHALAEY
jgi:hypothetical protein